MKRAPLVDHFHRSIDYARIAVTSQCNLRCSYCMREDHAKHAGGVSLLTKQEIDSIIKVLAALGLTKVRFTGGEPLLRRDIAELVRAAKNTTGIKTVSLTTNGLLLDRFLPALIDAGLDAINFSIDTLDHERYKAITRRNEYVRARENLDMLLKSSAIAVKLNVVVMRDINSDELQSFVDLTRDYPITVRFLELQPFDDNQIWRTGRFFSAEKIREMLQQCYPGLQPLTGQSTQYFSYTLSEHKGSVAIIPAFTRNFCSQCNRIRVTSNGTIISCLYEKEGLQLLPLLRGNASDDAIADLFRFAVSQKPEDGKHAGRNSSRTSMSEIGG
ncbi:MAG: GTP 3',8-cyclase MoaA [Chlorobium sp.]|nr:MAG: GTP 3',8-cyclase MoaA [Chlorobium sp.]